MAPPLTPEEFQKATNAGAEVVGRLAVYEGILRKWQKRMNLVGAGTLDDCWRRHFLDSAQALPLLPGAPGPVLDAGSGAGFPGLVLAVMGVRDVHLVEAHGRKCEFLRQAARETQTDVTIHHARLEDLAPFPVRAVTARALAPLPRLLEYIAPFLSDDTQCLIFKGQKAHDELALAEKDWELRAAAVPSVTNSAGFILKLEHLRRRHD